MSDFEFPERSEQELIVTGMMKQAERRTLDVHSNSPIVVWSGRSRIGKTTTAEWMTSRIADAFDVDNADAFKAKHYEVGEIPEWVYQPGKKAIRGLHHATIGRLDEGLYRSSTPEDLAELTVRGFKRRHVELVFVDEAGLLSLDAIRGLVLVQDRAVKEGHTLGIVLIGMDDLPHKVEANPQVEGRVQEWVFFEGYEDGEIMNLLQELHPPYRDRSLSDKEIQEHVAFLADTQERLPGRIVSFIHRLKTRLDDESQIPDLKLMRAVHLLTERDREAARTAATANYSHKTREDLESEGG